MRSNQSFFSFYSVSSFVCFAFAMLFLWSCSAPRTTQRSKLQYPYDWESKALHPELMLYHSSEDSSLLYFMINSDELLYTRSNPESPFQNTLRIELDIKEINGAYRDSIVFQYSSSNSDRSSQKIIGKNKINLPPSKDYRISAKIIDENRSTSSIAILLTSKAQQFHRDNFLIVDERSLAPSFGNSFEIGSTVIISSDRIKNETIDLHRESKDFALPPPPDAYARPNFQFDPREVSSIQQNTGVHILNIDSGLHVLSSPGFEGVFCLYGRVRDFPEVRELGTLTTSIRYICSRNEYRKIKDSTYPKKELDDFWIETAGSKEKAKELIAIYYNRVREANVYFSSLTEGWRTDRGLIHIVFGNPNKVIKDGEDELWIYGEESNLNSMTFRFVKQNSIYSDNHFILERNPMFKPGWDRAVSSWRNGRIFADR